MRRSQSFTSQQRKEFYKPVVHKTNSVSFRKGASFYNPYRYVFEGKKCTGHSNVNVAYDQAARKHVVVKKCRNIENELKVLRELSDCEHIQKMIQYDTVQKVIVYNYDPYGDLFEYTTKVRKLTTFESKNIVLIPILSALQYMHSLNHAHRDIKQENILYYPSGCKLIDFEFCEELPESGHFSDRKGTLECMAPEVFLKKSCLESDLWSLGIVYYECLHERNLFGVNRDIETVKKDVLNMNITIDLSLDIDDIGILKILICQDPEYRKNIYTHLLGTKQELEEEPCVQDQEVTETRKMNCCWPW